jgi:phosphatidylinositol-3-phosphatase
MQALVWSSESNLRRQFSRSFRPRVSARRKLASAAIWIAITAVMIGTGGPGIRAILHAGSSQQPLGVFDGAHQPLLFGNPEFAHRAAPSWSSTPTATAVAPTPAPTPRPKPSPRPAPHSATSHVLVIMEENKGYKATLGSCGADPYWCSLAARYASDTSWFGVSHPSEPNYVAFESGGIQGCTSDTSCSAGSVSVTDLGGQLTAKGIPWVSWMESMPSPCYTGAGSGGGQYVVKHSFGGFFKDEYTGMCHLRPYPGVSPALSTLDGASAPDFVWITPNVTDDMHDGSVQQGDGWLKANLAPILASTWFTGFNSTVIVTMDENDAQTSPFGGQVPMVIISSLAAGRGAVAIPGNHYGLLHSIEEVYRLPLLSAPALPVNGDLRALFG